MGLTMTIMDMLMMYMVGISEAQKMVP